MFFPLFSVTMYSNRRPNVLSCFFFFIIIIFFCHVFPKTLQPISTKLSDLCHDKICKKHTSCLLVLTSGPEIVKIYKFAFFFLLKTIFLKKCQRKSFQTFRDGKDFSATVPFAYPNVSCHFRLSPEENKKNIFIQIFLLQIFSVNFR